MLEQAPEKPQNIFLVSIMNVARKFIALPRLQRIVLIAIFALAGVLAIFSPIDQVYFSYFFDMNTRGVTAYVIAAIGLVFYMVGWYLLVGTVGRRPKPRLIAGIYVLLGSVMILLDAVLIIIGLIIQAKV